MQGYDAISMAMGHVWSRKLKTLPSPTTILNHISYLTVYMIRFMLNGIYICQDVTMPSHSGFAGSFETAVKHGGHRLPPSVGDFFSGCSWCFLAKSSRPCKLFFDFNLYLTGTVMLGLLPDVSDTLCLQHSNWITPAVKRISYIPLLLQRFCTGFWANLGNGLSVQAARQQESCGGKLWITNICKKWGGRKPTTTTAKKIGSFVHCEGDCEGPL